MANSGLYGPYSLTADGVSNNVKGMGPGAYALGQTKLNGNFAIAYVGRSDDDLAGRLQQHVPEHNSTTSMRSFLRQRPHLKRNATSTTISIHRTTKFIQLGRRR